MSDRYFSRKRAGVKSVLNRKPWVRVIALALLVSGGSTVITEVEAKSWNCYATVNLQGITPGISYSVQSWEMKSGKWFPDKERECKNYLTSNWLDNGKIWEYLVVTPQQQNQICRGGGASVQVEYGLDERKKSWSFTRSIPIPSCDCPKICPTSWLLDTKNLCAQQLSACGPVILPSEIFLAEDDKHGLYVRDNNIYQWQSPTVDKSNCTFSTGSKLAISSVRYGESNSYCDATSVFKQQCDGKSSCTVVVSNQLCGDPLYGVVKKAEIAYSCKGVSQVLTVPENQTANLSCN